jgi:hypothetical protein
MAKVIDRKKKTTSKARDYHGRFGRWEEDNAKDGL